MTRDVLQLHEDPAPPRTEAADWMALERSGHMSDDDRRAFQAWFDVGANAAAWRDLERSWRAAEALRVDPSIMALRELRRRQYDRPGHIRRLVVVAASLALVVMVAGSTAWKIGAFGMLFPTGGPERVYITAVGHTSTVTLADGSRVTLDADSALAVHPFGARRLVDLERGRAYFEVAHASSRPFIVTFGAQTVTAVGTAFDVAIGEAESDVTLTEGRVTVARARRGFDPAVSADLSAGTRLAVSGGGGWRISRVDPGKALAWLDGRLVFDNMPLREAALEMNRYSAKKLVIADPALRRRSIVGVFRAGDVDGFARAMRIARFARPVDRGDRIELVAR
jgi:transmembrane sensor